MSENKDFDCGTLSGATEVAFCFDTTGSIQPAIANVRKKIEQTCEELFTEIPDLKIGMIAHGDYCDGDECMTMLRLTDDKSKIFKFIREAPNTGGGDCPECYEFALRTARDLGWSKTEKAGRALVMIGDDEPHKVGEHSGRRKVGSGGIVCTMVMPVVEDMLILEKKSNDDSYANQLVDIDWHKELDALLEMGVKVYPMQCLFNECRPEVNRFWSQIAEICDTALIRLADFNESSEALAGLAFAASGSENFAKYETKLCSMNISADTMARNVILRGEAEKYDDLRKSE